MTKIIKLSYKIFLIVIFYSIQFRTKFKLKTLSITNEPKQILLIYFINLVSDNINVSVIKNLFVEKPNVTPITRKRTGVDRSPNSLERLRERKKAKQQERTQKNN